jgi:hypothetical protein
MVGFNKEMRDMKSIKDKKGQEIQPFDLLKVYHFTDSRRKKHFMYKWVKELDGRLVCYHMDSDNTKSHYRLLNHKVDEKGCCQEVEIVQSPRTLAAELCYQASFGVNKGEC